MLLEGRRRFLNDCLLTSRHETTKASQAPSEKRLARTPVRSKDPMCSPEARRPPRQAHAKSNREAVR